jgi:hypothetical protein
VRIESAESEPTGRRDVVYRVCIRSILDEGWLSVLALTPIATYRHYAGPPRTILVLQCVDQSELLGLLNRVHDMGLTLISVELSLLQTASRYLAYSL